MALINCPECGVQVSEFALECPKCGNPILTTKSTTNFEQKENPTYSKKIGNNKGSYISISGIFLIIIVLIGATLPFHYIPSRLLAFPKDQLTFSNTFITEADIENIINQFNNASLFERVAMLNDPFLKKLKEKNIIVDASNKSPNNYDKNSDSNNSSEDAGQSSFIFCQTPTILFTIESGREDETQIIAVPFVMYCDGKYGKIPVCELGATEEKAVKECNQAKKSILPIVSAGQILYIINNGLQSKSLIIEESNQYGFSDWNG